MSWRDEKADHLQKSRDFSFLQDDDRSQKDVQRSRQGKASEDRVPDNKEARDRLLRLKALEKQRADKQKKHYVESLLPDERDRRKETERSAGASGNKRGSGGYENFGSFFGKVEKVVAKRVVEEQRAREIAARERRLAEAEKPKPKADSRNGSDAKHSSRPGSSSGARPVAKPKPQNPVTVKAQKLKYNRDYSFLDEPASKPQGAEVRDSRPQPSKVSKESRPSTDGLAKQKPVVSQSQKPRPASNGVVRPSSGQGPSSAQPRKVGASRLVSAGERDNNARDSRYDSERRSEKESRYATAARPEREKPDRDGRYESERRAEQGRSAASSRLPSVGKSPGLERPASRGVTSKVFVDRDKRANQERLTSAARLKPTNHDRVVARDSSTMKSVSTTRVTQSSGQKLSQSGSASARERATQKSTTETKVSQSIQRGPSGDAAAMKRKMVGEPARKPVITAKSNDGRRVDRSRYEDDDSESEMRRLVAGGPRAPQSAGPRVSKPSAGLSRKLSEEPVRRKSIDVPIRRKPAEEPLRRKSSDEMRSRPAMPKERKRQRPLDSDEESESESDGPRPRKSGVSSIIQKLFRYNPNKYADLDDEDDKNMETSFKHIQAEERRSARLAREEDEREQELIEAEERAERERKLRRQKMMK